METYLRAFPDLHLAIEQIVATGSFVITRWHATGTHRGELMGIAPTNKGGSVRGCTVNELKNGKIVHE
jgi:predicted ester cyclase